MILQDFKILKTLKILPNYYINLKWIEAEDFFFEAFNDFKLLNLHSNFFQWKEEKKKFVKSALVVKIKLNKILKLLFLKASKHPTAQNDRRLELSAT